MRILREHASLLLKMKENGAMDEEWADAKALRELELADLVRLERPGSYVLTWGGERVADVLASLVQAGKLPSPTEWNDGWRWLGSETIAMIDSARRSGAVGSVAVEALQRRGFVEKDGSGHTLSREALSIMEVFERSEPRLDIDAQLARQLRAMPAGPTPTSTIKGEDTGALEAMRLIAFSVPDGAVYALTALGNAIKRAVEAAALPEEGTVLSRAILVDLERLLEGEDIGEEAKTLLMSLAYVDGNGELLPAGEWALEVHHILREGPRRETWTVALEEPELTLLQIIEEGWKSHEANPEVVPSYSWLRKKLLARRISQFEKLLREHAGDVSSMPPELQEAAASFATMEDRERWLDTFYDVRDALNVLESFGLVYSSVEHGEEVVRLTSLGRRVLEDQRWKRRPISSTAVKAITMTRKTFSAPSTEWVEAARRESLLGSFEPSKSGRFYAWFAQTVERRPYLSVLEKELFLGLVPGSEVTALVAKASSESERRRIMWALEKLEAHHLVEILPDNTVALTPAGRKMKEALSGPAARMRHPITPAVHRVLHAITKVGVDEPSARRVKFLPSRLKEVEQLSGLAPDVFNEALMTARRAGFMGKSSITEKGLDLLEAVRLMNPASDVVSLFAEE